jgi:hypothetical protein
MSSTFLLHRSGLILLMSVTCSWAQPTISYQPGHETYVVGQTPGYRVDASGEGPLTYQWMRNGSDIPGATAARYYGPAVQANHHGNAFSVRVTDAANRSLTSTSALLNVATVTANSILDDPLPEQACYHLDAIHGNDTTGNGSAEAPYRSFAKVKPFLTAGDTVLFHDGGYGELRLEYQPYSNWVTLMAAPGAAPSIERLYVNGGGHPSRVVWNGRFNMDYHLRVIGFTIGDGVDIGGANHVRVEQCIIKRLPPWNQSVEAIERAAVKIRACRSIVIADCEITEAPFGIGARGNDLVLRNNRIHHLSHDGIRLTGCDQVLVEGNTIHNLDDGAGEVNPPAWNRHCDGMHITMESGSYPIDVNAGLTIRGNAIYHCESMAIMYQNWSSSPPFNRDVVFENNVFGPSGGYMLHLKDVCLGFVFRNNSIVTIPNDQFQGLYRHLTCTDYRIGLPAYAASSGVEVFNNIFPSITGEWVTPTHLARFDHNLYYQKHATFPMGDDPVLSPTNPFLSTTSFTGEIPGDSFALNRASLIGAPVFDIRGVARDSQPDIGAWEYVSVNHPPSLQVPGSVSVPARENLIFQVEALDADSDQVLEFGAYGDL